METQSKAASARRWLGAAVGVALPALLCTMWIGGDPPVRSAFAVDECTAAQPNAGDYCASSKCGPCLEAEGDCDPGQCQAGLTCVEEGSVDRCRAVAPVCNVPVGATDYCSTSQCGPCGEGDGDCDDDNQCAAGLECVEEGTIDRCRAPNGQCWTSPNSIDYCDNCDPCGSGEGDCEAGECEVGFVCAEEGATDRCRSSSLDSNFQVQVAGVWKNICCIDGKPRTTTTDECWWMEYGRVLTDEIASLQLDCPEGGPTSCRCDTSGERMHSSTGDLSGLRNSTGSTFYSDHLKATCVVVDGNGELDTAWTSGSCPKFRLK